MAIDILTPVTVAFAVTVALATAAPGHAEYPSLNGVFTAQSNGDWAKTNQKYEDQASTVSRWTISSSCTTFLDCSGTVVSDRGWTAPISTTNGMWVVKRQIDGWQPCPDGSSAAGTQMIKFVPVDADGLPDVNSPTFGGEDITKSASGSCGRNQSLVIRMPFRMERIS